MLDLSSDFVPLASFIAGISGSLHCVGMCGGLVTASCSRGTDVLKYQVGRLLGYCIMGSLVYIMGHALKGIAPFHWGSLFSGILLGLLFIFWGVQSFQGKKAEIPLPGFLRKFYQYAFRNFVAQAGAMRALIVGLISIMLPCGLVYGVMIAALALGNYEQVMMSLLFFWLGTLPAMIGAPQLVKKVLEPLRKNLPKVYAILFIIIGVATIAGRLGHYPQTAQSKTVTGHRCH